MLPEIYIIHVYPVGWFSFATDFEGDQNSSVSPPSFSVLLLKLAFTATRLEDAASAEAGSGQAESLPLQRSPPQASDGTPERGCECLGAQGTSGSQAHQGPHQTGIQGLDPAFQSTGHS